MEYDIIAFASRLRQYFVGSSLMPNMKGEYTSPNGYKQSDSRKHPNRPEPRALYKQISDCFARTNVIVDENNISFDLGDEMLERNFPYYHILQQAPVIRKRNMGTKKSKGSQDSVKDLGKRDYEKVKWNGKTFTKEYTRNVRGSRIDLSRVSMRFGDEYLNGSARQYLNIHYNYIDRIIDDLVPKLASDYGMRVMRKQNSGLGEEYNAEPENTYTTDMVDIFSSFEDYEIDEGE